MRNRSDFGRCAECVRSAGGLMTITRFLPAVLIAAATAGSATAQYGDTGWPASGNTPAIAPAVLPGGYGVSPLPPVDPVQMPPGRPTAAANTTALDRVTAPLQPGAAAGADPVGMLTGQPAQQLPYGAYPSPYFTDGPGCCGPLGANGRIGYEILWYTGPAISFGEGRFGRELHTGWIVGGSGRSLFFNPAHDAAWVMDLGLSYQYNHGSPGHFQELAIRQAPLINPITGAQIPQPDVLTQVAIRGLDRTNFNFGLGRDWWLWGAGSTGLSDGLNWRVGALVGGRWGTAHVDLLPMDSAAFGDYQRRQGVTHGVFLMAHTTFDIPMGTWIMFGGLRAEWGYDWTNLIPPLDGNLHNVNLMLTWGIRF